METKELSGRDQWLLKKVPPGYTLEEWRKLKPHQKTAILHPEKRKAQNRKERIRPDPEAYVKSVKDRLLFERLLAKAMKDILLDKPDQSYIYLVHVAEMTGSNLDELLFSGIEPGHLCKPLTKNGMWCYPPDYVACLVAGFELHAAVLDTPDVRYTDRRFVDWKGLQKYLHQRAKEGGWVDFQDKVTGTSTKGPKPRKGVKQPTEDPN